MKKRRSKSSARSVTKSSTPIKINLKIDWATHEAAKYACENWHYSKCLPTGKLIKIGAWENGRYIGVVIFSRGASPHLLSSYKLTCEEGCELTRIALSIHQTPVSRILAIAIKFLRQKAPGIKLAVSFADPEQGHHGGIYQATNWIYTGRSATTIEYFVKGRWRHTRGAYKFVKGKTKTWPKRERLGKHRYLFPLDEALRPNFEPLREPYPKRAGSIVADAPGFHPGEGGSIPTPALQKTDRTRPG